MSSVIVGLPFSVFCIECPVATAAKRHVVLRLQGIGHGVAVHHVVANVFVVLGVRPFTCGTSAVNALILGCPAEVNAESFVNAPVRKLSYIPDEMISECA